MIAMVQILPTLAQLLKIEDESSDAFVANLVIMQAKTLSALDNMSIE
jgi:hypothetical protein